MRRVVGDDSGAVAIFVAIMAFVLIGSLALAVDVGGRYQERRQMQNAADAGSLGVAKDCATKATCPVAPATTTANGYRSSNTTVSNSSITRVCGPAATTLPACPANQGPWDCPLLPGGALATAPYVQVETKAWAPPLFAGVFGNTGNWVRSCARASWGSPGSLSAALPITLSKCEFDNALPLKALPIPPYPGPSTVIYLHDPDPTHVCKDSRSGADLPGGFGYLSTSTCTSVISDLLGWFDDKTGNSPPSSCSNAIFSALVGTTIQLPIFNDLNGSPGTNGAYRMYGYASFVLTGYQLGGQYKQKDASRGNAFPCSNPQNCISGFFVSNPVPTQGTIGGPPGTGVAVVQSSG
ncbi:MAG: Tad domain-containing protein [Actinomycetota bacterium]